jgi:cysteine desulfurase
MRIYLDHNATTPLRDEVVEAMIPVLARSYGNPSSTHAEGAEARALVDRARDQVAEALGVSANEVLFTAGATEANNTVLRGVAATWAGQEAGREARQIVTSQTEHPSIEAPCASLEDEGIRVVRLAVDPDGLLDADEFSAALSDPRTLLASVLWANNETGVLQPIAELAELARARGVSLHVDATQALGKLPVDLGSLPVDFLSCSAHKLNGPKGVGCLVVRQGRSLPPLLAGGPQERTRRGGTENVAGIVGFGVACDLARRELASRGARYAQLRDRLWEGIRAKVPRVRRNGSSKCLLPNTLNVEFCETPGEVLLQALDLEGVAASAGAACHAGAISPSHVLTAMGRTPEQARGSLRFSVGHGNDEEQIDRVVELLVLLVERARSAEAP